MAVPSRLLVAAAVLAVGVLGAVLGVLLAGRLTTGVGPFEARMSVRPALGGGTELALPPLGELQLRTHAGPVHLDVEVVRLREDAAREIVRNPDRLSGLGQEVQRDLVSGLRRLVLHASLATVTGAAVLGFLVFRRVRRTAVAGAAGLATLLSAAAWTWLTFDENALSEPRYTGLLAVAPTAVGDVRDIVADFGTYSRSLGKLVTNVSDLYDVTSSLPTFAPDDDGIRLLHVSDLHLSPLGYEVMASVVQQFRVDAVVDTGDLTDFGSEPESRYLDGITRLGVPYVYVRGNHDSVRTATGVRNRGSIVLDGTVATVAGVRLLGSPDPRFTPDKSTGDDDAPPEVVLAQGRALADKVRAGADPDVVLVHDPVAAEPLRGVVPLVLAGHRHSREATTVDDTLLLTEGSTGGAGLRGLEADEPTPIELSVLYLDRETRRLQAYDQVTLGGLGTSSARIERRVAARPPPSGPPSPPTSP